MTQPDGKSALLITYGGGGLTPGDAYLWLLDETMRPRAWRMWVSIIPLKGIESSWEGWTALPTGAWVATEHRMTGFTLRLRRRGGGFSGRAWPGADPSRRWRQAAVSRSARRLADVCAMPGGACSVTGACASARARLSCRRLAWRSRRRLDLPMTMTRTWAGTSL